MLLLLWMNTVSNKMDDCSKRSPILILLLGFFMSILFLFATIQTLIASECYHYHTSKSYQIIVKNNGVYYQFTERDPNGFSYARQVTIPIKGIDKESYKSIGEDEGTLMFSDKNGFYMLSKREPSDDKEVIYSKVLGPNINQKHINGRLYFIDGKWVYMDGWGNNITKVELTELPRNLVNVKCYSYSMYVKNENKVFVVSIDLNSDKKYTWSEIPHLNPENLIYYSCNQLKNEDYIADENHMFCITKEGSFADVTPQLMALGVKNYNSLKLINADIPMWQKERYILKKRDGASVSSKDPLTGKDIDVEYSYSGFKPLIPAYGNINYALYANKIYPIWDDNFSQAYTVKTDAAKLKVIQDKLLQGSDFYYFEDANNFKIISTNISADAKFFPEVYSYNSYLPKALVDENYIYFIADQFKTHLDNKKRLTSQIVKQLGTFYLFNNSLFDGKKSYPIIADYASISYLGSYVEVLNACSGDMPNSEQVAVKYHHFFKDKNKVFYFDEQKEHLQIIQTADPRDYIYDDYLGMKTLYKIKDLRGGMSISSSPQVNYYWFGCIATGLLGVIAYVLKKRS